jgi:hypothetical protein
MNAMATVDALPANLPDSALIKSPPTRLVEFKPPVAAPPSPRHIRKQACTRHENQPVTCRDDRCFGEPDQLTCFSSPDNPQMSWAKAEKLVDARPNPEYAAYSAAMPWAIETSTGMICTSSADRTRRNGYRCANSEGTNIYATQVFKSGETFFAVMGSRSEPEGAEIVLVSRAWK